MDAGVLQIGTQFYLKIETCCIFLKVSSLAEAVSYLCASYFVFNFDYPPILSNLFSFFERVFGIPYKKGIAVRNQKICDFITKLK